MSDDGKTFEEILSENLAAFGWEMSAAEIPEHAVAQRTFQATTTWYHSLDEVTATVVNNVDLSAGMKVAGFFDEWPALERIFKGKIYGTNADTVLNAVTCFNNAFNRQFQTVE